MCPMAPSLGTSFPPRSPGGWDGPQTPLWRLNLVRFPDLLLGELVPLVDRTYALRGDRNSRAIAGLSMGGGETVYPD
jgi:S-formylglutathione hydrolase FrmB